MKQVNQGMMVKWLIKQPFFAQEQLEAAARSAKNGAMDDFQTGGQATE
jgi:hypothetical protein